MTTIVTRAGKGSPLTWNEVDTNFTNLNSAKYESGNNVTLGTIGGTTISGTSFSSSGNLTFTGTGNRIIGDFSNATLANRVSFQTSTTNGNTWQQVIPNGTGQTSGFLTFNGSDAANSAFGGLFISPTNYQITTGQSGTGTNVPMLFSVAGSERVRIDTSGNVGIGTSSPSAKLGITAAGDATFNSQVVIAPVSGTNPAKITFNPTVSSAIAGLSDGSVAFYGNGANTERMRIDASGNVGIGTSSPSTFAGSGARSLSIGGTVLAGEATYSGYGQQNAGAINFYANSAGGTFIRNLDICAFGDALPGGAGSVIKFLTQTTGVSSLTERMRIDSSGNVGIGKTATTLLDVNGTVTATGWAGGGIVTTGTANTFTAQQTFKELKDTVHTITDAAGFQIDPANGSIQTITLGANRTPVATNFEAGQVVLLGIDDGTAFTITWTSVPVTWVKAGGTASAPTLATTGFTWVLLWKVGTTIYGVEVGKP